MPNQSSKGRKDLSQLAFAVVQQATGQAAPEVSLKNPAAVALGRLGGLKGGRARAAILSVDERKKIAQVAARKRWGKPIEDDKS
jgi:hypothetical protein